MSNAGRSRNARLNQAMKHTIDVRDNLYRLVGNQKTRFIDDKDAWADARNSLELLVQCFHEANAYNNAMLEPEPHGPMVTTSDFESENSGSSPDVAANQ